MATFKDVLAAVAHVQNVTGNPTGWQAGLSPGQVRIVLAPMAGFTAKPDQLEAILAEIRARNPALFDPATGAPVTPPPGGGPQRGAAAEAMKNAEGDLAQVQSAVAEFDRQMIEAILHAHQTTQDGQRRLAELERDVEHTVATLRLDTPLGAREFQRYLIGKLREILAVVQETNDDDTSKQALAAAWAALYAAQGGGDTGGPAPTAPAGPPAAVPDSAPEPDTFPIDEAFPGEEIFPSGEPGPPAPAVPAAAAPPPAYPVTPALPALGAPAGGALPAGLPPLSGLLPAPGREEHDQDPPEDPFTDDERLPDDPVDDEVDDEVDDPAPETDPSTVTLPDGETVTAASPELAAVITAATTGTPIAEAFEAQGITIPPPGTAVAAPIEATQVIPGDIGMFTDRHALAVSPSKAVLDGQIQRIANVAGPSFLGWQHPPVTPSVPTAPEPPTPTRPSATVAP